MATRGWEGVTEPMLAPGRPKRAKYGNTKVAGFDSTKEARRWQELELLERAGQIQKLRKQVEYALVVNGVLICRYLADFVYEDGARTVVEDVKSPPTRKKPDYRLKLKLMRAIHQIEIHEV